MIARVKTLALFLYHFVVGDDWRVAVGVVLALAVTAAASRVVPAWWIMPVAVLALLVLSVRRALRAR